MFAMPQDPQPMSPEQIKRLAEVQARFHSKADLYEYFTTCLVSRLFLLTPLQFMYLPRAQNCPLEHLQDIAEGRKKFFYQNQVKHIKVPVWPELATAKIWKEAVLLQDFNDYMPRSWNGDQKTERPYFYAILGTVADHFLLTLIRDCRTQRKALRDAIVVQKPLVGIRFAPGIVDLLLQESFKSKCHPTHTHRTTGSNPKAKNVNLFRQAQAQAARNARPQPKPKKPPIVPVATMREYLLHLQQVAQQEQQQQQQRPRP